MENFSIVTSSTATDFSGGGKRNSTFSVASSIASSSRQGRPPISAPASEPTVNCEDFSVLETSDLKSVSNITGVIVEFSDVRIAKESMSKFTDIPGLQVRRATMKKRFPNSILL